MPLLTGWPTDAGDGSVSTEARWRAMARLWAPSGVVDGYLDRLDPDYALGAVTVGAGAAWIDGHYANSSPRAAVAVTSNGLVVIRWTPAANTFELLYRDGATTPTQTDPTWELPLAQMTGGAMTDLREFVTRGTVTTGMIDTPRRSPPPRWPAASVTAFIETGGNVTNTDTTLPPARSSRSSVHVHQAGGVEHLRDHGVGVGDAQRRSRRRPCAVRASRRGLQPRRRTQRRRRRVPPT